MVLRSLNVDEKRLLVYLVENAGDSKFTDFDIDSIRVKDMEDGGMGSLQLFPLSGSDNHDGRVFGRALSDCCFDDEDGVKVIATLNLDKQDSLFELDVWKTNYEKLIRIPENFFKNQ